MTVAQQAELLASAKVVVAPHGAGLSNVVFCETNTPLIEIMHPDYPVNCYEKNSRKLAAWTIANSRPATCPPDCKDDREAESEVDIAQVLEAIPAEFMSQRP